MLEVSIGLWRGRSDLNYAVAEVTGIPLYVPKNVANLRYFTGNLLCVGRKLEKLKRPDPIFKYCF